MPVRASGDPTSGPHTLSLARLSWLPSWEQSLAARLFPAGHWSLTQLMELYCWGSAVRGIPVYQTCIPAWGSLCYSSSLLCLPHAASVNPSKSFPWDICF